MAATADVPTSEIEGTHPLDREARAPQERRQQRETGPHAAPQPPQPPAPGAEDPSLGELRLPSEPASAGLARRITRHQLGVRWQLPEELTENAVLLVSELVGNAVQHAGAPSFGLRFRRRRGSVRVEVSDPSRALPVLLPVREMAVLTGRGLFLVDTLADRWGVDLLPHGKCTWFEMRAPHR
ncbi:ATP-binding protein [Streptomyces profundus]|uniref:ATP-binding protein n=1 Tax=Streptomyces profundus TaxID=2867410 RepID=UPI001D165B6E|nr:ATP-binding protein [Streptomyces sp. MA3_2.13]UED83962.1 ATP-binding protein [Streptomyces sp. MA3_2.13]